MYSVLKTDCGHKWKYGCIVNNQRKLLTAIILATRFLQKSMPSGTEQADIDLSET